MIKPKLMICLTAILMTSCAGNPLTVEDARTIGKRIGKLCYQDKTLAVMDPVMKRRNVLTNRFFGHVCKKSKP